jgi:membrane-bound metal-dependent hydrolase YbcI (DUF457 family)
MPFTPFHLGPALLLGLALFPYLDLSALLVSSVIVDLEPLLVVLGRLDYPLHGFFHTYLGSSILAISVAISACATRGWTGRIMEAFNLRQDSSSRKVLATSLLGAYSHVFLDSFLNTDMEPFYPLRANPLLGAASAPSIYMLCMVSFVVSIALYALKLIQIREQKPSMP